MNKYIKTLAIGLMTGASVLTTSCNLDYKPIDNFSASSFWGSQTEFEGFITAISNQFRSANASNVLFYAGELRSGVFEMATIDGSGILNSEPLQNIMMPTIRSSALSVATTASLLISTSLSIVATIPTCSATR